MIDKDKLASGKNGGATLFSSGPVRSMTALGLGHDLLEQGGKPDQKLEQDGDLNEDNLEVEQRESYSTCIGTLQQLW